MSHKRARLAAFGIAVFACGVIAGQLGHILPTAQAARPGQIFELRTYTTHEGKLEALQSRFRDHTLKLFEKQGMKNVGYWIPADAPLAQNTLIYILAHDSREAAARSWAAFFKDPVWIKAKAESEAAGEIVVKVDSVFMNAADFSPLK